MRGLLLAAAMIWQVIEHTVVLGLLVLIDLCICVITHTTITYWKGIDSHVHVRRTSTCESILETLTTVLNYSRGVQYHVITWFAGRSSRPSAFSSATSS